MTELSKKAVFLGHVYLYNVLAYIAERPVTNAWGHNWVAFEPLMRFIEEAVNLTRKEAVSFRIELYLQFKQQRMDLLFESLGETLEKLCEEQHHAVHDWITMFPNIYPLVH